MCQTHRIKRVLCRSWSVFHVRAQVRVIACVGFRILEVLSALDEGSFGSLLGSRGLQ